MPNDTMTRKPWLLDFEKNPSWKASAKLVFSRTLLYLPSSLFWLIKDSIMAALIGITMLIVGCVFWVGVSIAQVCAGLAGYLTDPIKETK